MGKAETPAPHRICGKIHDGEIEIREKSWTKLAQLMGSRSDVQCTVSSELRESSGMRCFFQLNSGLISDSDTYSDNLNMNDRSRLRFETSAI
jgi:hypothetical protein